MADNPRAVIFATKHSLGGAGWLVSSYISQNISYLNEVISEENSSGSSQVIKRIYRVNQKHNKATLWTAFNTEPDKMYGISDMPSFTGSGSSGDLMIDWFCSGFVVEFDQENLIYHCHATYESFGYPIETKPLKVILPQSLADVPVMEKAT